MKICLIIDLPGIGGASIAANRTLDSVEQIAEPSMIASDFDQSKKTPSFCLQAGKKFKIFELFASRMLPVSLYLTLRDLELKRQLSKILNRIKPDIINFHNIHSAGWPIDLVANALNYAPVVWTLHDCWSFLGTYYPTHAPLPDERTLGKLKATWASLRKGKSHHSLSALTPSAWMQNQASSSFWEGNLVKTIHNPTPESFFQDRDRKACKKALGLSQEKPVVLTVAGNLDEERKGGTTLKKILSSSLPDLAQFVLIGNGKGYETSDRTRINCLGFVRDETTMQIAYHAADLLLHPAPIDNLPNTVSESMSCGTPAVAFDTGGLPEMVIPEKSGWLVQEINSESIARELGSIIKSRAYENLRGSTRQTAFRLFHHKEIAQSYKNHFQLVKNQE